MEEVNTKACHDEPIETRQDGELTTDLHSDLVDILGKTQARSHFVALTY